MDSNQGYNPYKWVICALTRVINLHITSYIQYPEPLSQYTPTQEVNTLKLDSLSWVSTVKVTVERDLFPRTSGPTFQEPTSEPTLHIVRSSPCLCKVFPFRLGVSENSGVFPSKASISTRFSTKNPSILGYLYFWKHQFACSVLFFLVTPFLHHQIFPILKIEESSPI